MKIPSLLAAAAPALPGAVAFAPSVARRIVTARSMIGRDSNVDLGGNAWKPDSEKMGVSSFDRFGPVRRAVLSPPWGWRGDMEKVTTTRQALCGICLGTLGQARLSRPTSCLLLWFARAWLKKRAPPSLRRTTGLELTTIFFFPVNLCTVHGHRRLLPRGIRSHRGRLHLRHGREFLPSGFLFDTDIVLSDAYSHETMLGPDPSSRPSLSPTSFPRRHQGSSAMLNQGDRGPALPGMENLGADAEVMGGIEEVSDIPDGMEFVMSSVPDGTMTMDVAASSKGAELLLSVKPVCMGFEDYYAAFDKESHHSFSVSPVAGRMDRRGGEPTELTVTCKPTGQAGEFVGNLVINLPEDNSKICYKITATSF
ncbi:hypothetical protein ACHAWF_001461 [Thalassiosira exigua]